VLLIVTDAVEVAQSVEAGGFVDDRNRGARCPASAAAPDRVAVGAPSGRADLGARDCGTVDAARGVSRK